MPTPTMLWYDYETTGTDPRRDRPLQFAAIRTTPDLHPVGESTKLFCTPAADTLPHPEACLITGITPQDATRDGRVEAEFAGAVHELLAAPGTCSVGYNSIRFDDEVNRNLFYRNFFDPYAHTWRCGTSRWDLMDLARACYALRPDGITWPHHHDGKPSFRLEDLTAANGLEHQRAHDALSDVEATIALARRLRQCQPRLYDWYFALRDKRNAAAKLAAALPGMRPMVHVSGRYPPGRGCLAIVAPIVECPGRAGSFIVVDLTADPASWVDLAPDDLVERLFTRRADLPGDFQRPPLKAVHANKSPFLAPLATLRSVDAPRIALDPDRCLHNLERLRASDGLVARVRQAFAYAWSQWPERRDPECRLYAGFPSDADRRRCDQVRATAPAQLASTAFAFTDAGYTELLFRYRARNWPDTLTTPEQARWRAFVQTKLSEETEITTLTLEQYFATIAGLRETVPPGPKQALLDQLEGWGETRRAEFGL